MAVHKETGFAVAIKIYDKFKIYANQQVKKSISKEIKLLSQLCNTDRACIDSKFGQGHPNIMKLYDAIDTPKQLYLICESIKGKMLFNILREQIGKQLAVPVCKKVFKQLMEGMVAYHSDFIAHRDLKPENILVDMDCPNYTTKIIDFGFAAKNKDKMQIFCGTPAYMSPEICNQGKYDGPAADIWASGIILYMMLFGDQPFKAQNE
jgi:serine/threonine protein kinase